MVTSLGGAGYNGLALPVIATAAIPRARVVAHANSGAGNPVCTFLDPATVARDFGTGGALRLLDIPLLQVKLGVVDTATDGASPNFGISLSDIPIGGVGLVVVFGVVRCNPNGIITAGEVVAPAANGQLLDAANASHANPCGCFLENTTAADDLRWAFINFLGSFGGIAGTSFNGKAY